MLQTTSQSPQKQYSKRFALKKDLPNIKQFRKLYKHYNNIQHCQMDPMVDQKYQKKQALLEIERLSNQQILNFDINEDFKTKKDESKSNCEECAFSPFSQNTLLEELQQKEQSQIKQVDMNLLYSLYIEQQFNEEKKEMPRMVVEIMKKLFERQALQRLHIPIKLITCSRLIKEI